MQRIFCAESVRRVSYLLVCLCVVLSLFAAAIVSCGTPYEAETVDRGPSDSGEGETDPSPTPSPTGEEPAASPAASPEVEPSPAASAPPSIVLKNTSIHVSDLGTADTVRYAVLSSPEMVQGGIMGPATITLPFETEARLLETLGQWNDVEDATLVLWLSPPVPGTAGEGSGTLEFALSESGSGEVATVLLTPETASYPAFVHADFEVDAHDGGGINPTGSEYDTTDGPTGVSTRALHLFGSVGTGNIFAFRPAEAEEVPESARFLVVDLKGTVSGGVSFQLGASNIAYPLAVCTSDTLLFKKGSHQYSGSIDTNNTWVRIYLLVEGVDLPANPIFGIKIAKNAVVDLWVDNIRYE